MEAYYIVSGFGVKTLSAFWGAARIKNGRNQGGWGLQAAKYAHDYGCPLESFHAPMNFKVNKDPEAEANAKQHQIVNWEELDPKDELMVMTYVVHDVAITVGIPAWGHEVCLTFLETDGNKILKGFDNSWNTTWGNNGRGLLTGNKAKLSEAGAVLSVEPSHD
jgi:hypothetical protein